MVLPPNFVASLTPINPAEMMAALRERPWGKHQSLIEIQNQVRPFDLFCYLGARFGPPNGIQSILRSDDSDNLVHWDWSLRHESGVVIFQGHNFRTQVHLMGLPAEPGHLGELVQQLKADFASHGTGMTEVRKHLEQWVEFVNPYQRIRRSVDSLLDELDTLDLRPAEDQFDPFSSTDLSDETSKRWGAIAEKYSRGLGLCFGVRAMVPVMAEALVNLLLAVLVRKEIRADKRLMDNVLRQPIDVRIKSLSINCQGFKQAPDYSSEQCRAYQTLVNERNDLLHGNVVIEKLKFNDVYFWGKVPVFKEYRSGWQRSLQIEVDSVGLQSVKSEVATVDALRDYLFSCLDDQLRPHIVRMAEAHHLGFNELASKFGILFPETLAEMRVGPPDTET